MTNRLQQTLLSAWTTRGSLAWALRPVAAAYGLLGGLRRMLYRARWWPSHRLPVPVIVVGNVVVGGAGKTPTVIGIAQHLRAQGWQVGIVSRGYGRQSDSCQAVDPDDDPATVGDEPLLLRRKTGVPVYVASQRTLAAQALLQDHPHTNIIICDDGLQHYALYRDVEICVFDARGIGNGWLLPAGPLREPWPLRSVSTAGQAAPRTLSLHTGPNPLAGFRATRMLADFSVGMDGDVQALQALSAPGSPPLLAVAGIAQPEVFFNMLRAQGLHLQETLALPDHYDFNSWPRNKYAAYTVICTEKDGFKLWKHVPLARAVPLLQTAPPDFYTALDQRLRGLGPTPLSSKHGHQTS